MAVKKPIVNYSGKQVELQAGDTLDSGILDGVIETAGDTEFTQSFEFVGKYDITYFASGIFVISNIYSKEGQTITVNLNGSPYTLLDPIVLSDEIEVIVDEVSPIDDFVVLTCLSPDYDLRLSVPVYDSMSDAITALGSDKLFKYSTTNIDGATSSSVHITE